MALRFNPPPGWPLPPGFVPGPGWQPDPSWPPAPPGWTLWVSDDAFSGATQPAPGQYPSYPGQSYPGQGYQDQGYQGQGYQDQAYGGGGYQGQGFQPYQGYTYGQPPPRAGTNGFAITSFILGIIGGTLLSLVFGIIALVQIRNRGRSGVRQGGRGLAIAGMVLSVLWIVVVVALFAGGAITVNPQPGPTGVATPGRINIFSLKVGDCFQNPPPSQSARGVTTVSVVPCTTAHNAQVFAQFDATDSSYPGSAALIKEAQDGCQARVSADVDKSKITSTMTLRFLYPLPASWADGRRTITCLVVDSTKDLTSTLLSH